MLTAYINSSNRAEEVITHKQLRGIVPFRVVVPYNQYKDYRKHFKTSELLRIDKGVPEYLSSQRQWVMDTIQDDYIWYLDDDLEFLHRYTNHEGKLRLEQANTKHIKSMYKALQQHLSEIPVVGISTRLGNNRVQQEYLDNTRITRCYAINRKLFIRAGITFAPFEPFLAQDFHIAVSMLNAGHKNRVLYTYAQEDKGGSNAKGGCSSYRTPELMKKVAIWMSRNHPEIKVTLKSSKAWKGFKGQGKGNVRYDMTVQWKKAYKPKIKTGRLKSLFKKEH